MKIKSVFKNPAFWISAIGVVAAAAMYIYWFNFGDMHGNGDITKREYITGFVAVSLFVVLCLRFVPEWFNFWKKDYNVKQYNPDYEKGHMGSIFGIFIAVDLIYILIVALIQIYSGMSTSLDFWRCLDSDHYLNIAKEGYLSVGSESRLVELVFLPGYPMAVGLLNVVIRNYEVSGLIVSAVFFGFSGCMFYKVLRLDYNHEDSMRAIKYLLLCPGVFFFVAPMSESLFLFSCLSCIYLVRSGKVTRGCLMGAVASFTRSVGMGLVVPVFFELIHNCTNKDRIYSLKSKVSDFASLIIIPAGFLLYCLISYNVSGNPFQFMLYQSEHWGQEFGFFFAQMAHQFERVLFCIETKHVNLFGMWLPNFIACFLSLITMSVVVKKIRPSYIAWFIVYFAITIGAKALLSGPRYLLVCFPIVVSHMLLTKNKHIDKIATCLCIVCALVYTYAFVMRWCVW